nr:MAG TPA: hypothetical protein [Caudoviricetes sp.]
MVLYYKVAFKERARKTTYNLNIYCSLKSI